MLSLENLAVERGDFRLFEALNLELPQGSLMQVVGPNGAGKTSLLAAVAGLLPMAQGRVCWNKRDVRQNRSAYVANFSYLGHAAGLKAALTPMENLRFLMALRSQQPSTAQMFMALTEVGLSGYEHTPLIHLSAGQKRRVALARLRMEASPLWILDEPFTAIDRQGVVELEQQLHQHADSGGMVLFTTHHEMTPSRLLQALDLTHFRVQEDL
ncbi:MAG: cytochrome c biogenesis heme-transporting ATPase CcmA [Pseudomonadales bacterium]|nr:cytochrome c biogenesis heme-transporting ATPase CcmA [Pseudomonadales bacterium]